MQQEKCYFMGCNKTPSGKEHVPPKSFFPKGSRQQLITVPACEAHNNSKSKDDFYALAKIANYCSPYSSLAKEVYDKKISSQLSFNEGAFEKTLKKEIVSSKKGQKFAKVDKERITSVFSSIAYGIIFHIEKEQVPINKYKIWHIFHDWNAGMPDSTRRYSEAILHMGLNTYPNWPELTFGDVSCENESVYNVKVFGVPNFRASISVFHTFYDFFRVTSMLTRVGA